MKGVKVNGYAKINLTLDIIGRLENGYHDLRMVMQSLDLSDTVTITPNDLGCVRLKCSAPFVPSDAKNVACRAAQAFFEKLGIEPTGLDIGIFKRIPVSAGLAGGSADAAAVIMGLDRLFGTSLTPEQMCDIGVNVGADVPFCITGGTALVEGIGERITPLPDIPDVHILLVKPGTGLSTARIFSKYDEMEGIPRRPQTAAVIDAIKNHSLQQLAANLCNVLEPVASAMCHEISKIKSEMRALGALGAEMSGSGPTVFGLYDDLMAAKNAARSFLSTYSNVFICSPSRANLLERRACCIR